MKKVKFIFWLLGVGCGTIGTGIIGTIISLQIQDELKLEEPRKQELYTSVEMIENVKTKDEKNQKQVEEVYPEKRESLAEEEQLRKVDISEEDTAVTICQRLEKEGLIDRADNFLAYIRACNKQRLLKHGSLWLPLNASYEVLLQELTSS